MTYSSIIRGASGEAKGQMSHERTSLKEGDGTCVSGSMRTHSLLRASPTAPIRPASGDVTIGGPSFSGLP